MTSKINNTALITGNKTKTQKNNAAVAAKANNAATMIKNNKTKKNYVAVAKAKNNTVKKSEAKAKKTKEKKAKAKKDDELTQFCKIFISKIISSYNPKEEINMFPEFYNLFIFILQDEKKEALYKKFYELLKNNNFLNIIPKELKDFNYTSDFEYKKDNKRYNNYYTSSKNSLNKNTEEEIESEDSIETEITNLYICIQIALFLKNMMITNVLNNMEFKKKYNYNNNNKKAQNKLTNNIEKDQELHRKRMVKKLISYLEKSKTQYSTSSTSIKKKITELKKISEFIDKEVDDKKRNSYIRIMQQMLGELYKINVSINTNLGYSFLKSNKYLPHIYYVLNYIVPLFEQTYNISLDKQYIEDILFTSSNTGITLTPGNVSSSMKPTDNFNEKQFLNSVYEEIIQFEMNFGVSLTKNI